MNPKYRFYLNAGREQVYIYEYIKTGFYHGMNGIYVPPPEAIVINVLYCRLP